jgi:hypothetical protein
LKTGVKLRFRCISSDVGKQLGSVLAPDNAAAPRGLVLSMSSMGNTVSFQMGSDSPSTALSTAMAILRDVSLFEQVWLLSRANDGWQPEPVRK